jgi:hypothetical protein
MTRRSSLRRLCLGALALGALLGPGVGSGCATDFAPINQVDTLRVLAVVADKPYAKPGDTVTFAMTYADPQTSRPPEIVWFGGCFDPEGDAYYGCYPQLEQLFQSISPEDPTAGGLVGAGKTFSLKLPDDLITQRPKPASGTPYYGIAIVFFAACQGHLGPAPAPSGGTGLAGSFPLGCFDDAGNALDADYFVPGFTQVYAFADGRQNHNPVVEALAVTPDTGAGGGGGGAGKPVSEVNVVPPCSVPEDVRLGPYGCGRADPFSTCTPYDVSVLVNADVAEVDPSSPGLDGKPLHEVVWVDYFADLGDIDTGVLLVSDAIAGIQSSFVTRWIPPPQLLSDAGKPVKQVAHLWGVVHDSRGGQTVVERDVGVK